MTERKEYKFYSISEVYEKGLSIEAEDILKEWRIRTGYTTWAGFASKLRSIEWTYYDILEVASP